MRTIALLQNRRKAWYVHTTSGADTVSLEEDFSSPAHAQRAFMTEGRHQPFARMVVIVGEKKLVVRKSSPVPPLDKAWADNALAMIRAAMKVPKLH